MLRWVAKFHGFLAIPAAVVLVKSTQCDAMMPANHSVAMISSGNVRKDEHDDSHWEYKRNSCQFCKMFLDSPCQAPFKRWSSCTDSAKSSNEDPNASCLQFSEALLTCSSSNDAYFRMEAIMANNEQKQQIENGRRKYVTTTRE